MTGGFFWPLIIPSSAKIGSQETGKQNEPHSNQKHLHIIQHDDLLFNDSHHEHL